jgi:glycosyltransferase involved in cell wall biosynthesis
MLPTGALDGFRLLRGMISVLIETKDDEEGLARTLSTLIGGAVEGLVREVIVCDRGSTDQTHKVAEHAGCAFIEGTTAVRPSRNGFCCWSPARA